MKYNNLVGKPVTILNGTEYWCSHWTSDTHISKYTGDSKYIIDQHKICDIKGPLFGIECIYCKITSKSGHFFICPVWEFEKLGLKQLFPSYEIY